MSNDEEDSSYSDAIDYNKMTLEEILSDMELHPIFWRDLEHENIELIKYLKQDHLISLLLTWITDPETIKISYKHGKNVKKFKTGFIWTKGQSTDQVYLVGSFLDDWRAKYPLQWNEMLSLFYGEMMLPPGEYQYKYIVNGLDQYSAVNPTVDDGSGGVNNVKVVEGPQPGKPTVIHVATQILTRQEVADYMMSSPKILDQIFSFITNDNKNAPKDLNVWDWFKVARLLVCAHVKGLDLVQYFSSNATFNIGQILIDNIGKEHVFQLLLDMLNPGATIIQWAEYCNKPYFNLLENMCKKLEKIRNYGVEGYTYGSEIAVINLSELVKMITKISPEVTLKLRSNEELSRLVVDICFASNPLPMARHLIEFLNALIECSKNLREFYAPVDKPILSYLLQNTAALGNLKKFLTDCPFSFSKEHFGSFRLELIRTCLLLLQTNFESVQEALFEHGIISTVFDQLFRYPFVNIAHCSILELFETLAFCDDLKYFASWIVQYNLPTRINEAVNDPSNSQQIAPYLYLLSYKITSMLQMIPELGEQFQDYLKSHPLPIKPELYNPQTLGPSPFGDPSNSVSLEDSRDYSMIYDDDTRVPNLLNNDDESNVHESLNSEENEDKPRLPPLPEDDEDEDDDQPQNESKPRLPPLPSNDDDHDDHDDDYDHDHDDHQNDPKSISPVTSEDDDKR